MREREFFLGGGAPKPPLCVYNSITTDYRNRFMNNLKQTALLSRSFSQRELFQIGCEMVQIACFADDEALLAVIQRALHQPGVSINMLSASALSDDVRQAARGAAPDLILLELAPALANAHVIFFLRADTAMRSVPIVLLSHTPYLTNHAAALGADAFIRLPATAEQIADTVFRLVPKLTTREVGIAPTRVPAALPS
jgi:CheY-like chemotaxis protein